MGRRRNWILGDAGETRAFELLEADGDHLRVPYTRIMSRMSQISNCRMAG
jgi:hypothetical protein